jgi:hypothetical protein
MQCAHCGKLAIFTVRAEGRKDGAVIIDSPYNEGQDIITWRILECTWCKNPTFEETKADYQFVEHALYAGVEPVTSETNILYPSVRGPISLKNVPKAIEKEYMSALKYQSGDPNACALYVGRTLDEVCNYEKIKDARLVERLNELIKSKNLPAPLATMAHKIRHIRNLGAHADGKNEVTEEDVPIILDFVELILEYLYVAPAKITYLQERLNRQTS